MQLKRSLTATFGTAALSGAILLASIAPGLTCAFSKGGALDSMTSSSPSSSTTTTEFNLSSSNPNKLAIVGGAAAVLGLLGGGILLKRLTRRPAPTAAELPQAEPVTVEATEEATEWVEPTPFAIPVPPDALSSAVDEDVADVASVR